MAVANRKVRQPRTEQHKAHTGNRNVDRERFESKDFKDKADRPVSIDVGANAGDMVDGLFSRLLSPSVMMTLGYAGAGICLSVGIYAYSRLLVPALAGSLPLGFGMLAGYGLSLVLGTGLQLLEVFPRLSRYFPEQAARLAIKLKLTPVPQPKEDANSPSLLPKANELAKDGHENLFKDMQGASALAYGLEALAALWTFKLMVAGALNVPGVIGAVIAIAGFEICLSFVAWMKLIRLNARQSRHYREHIKALRVEAEQSLQSQSK